MCVTRLETRVLVEFAHILPSTPLFGGNPVENESALYRARENCIFHPHTYTQTQRRKDAVHTYV